MKNILILILFFLTQILHSQCNTNISICQPGVAGPFGFGNGGTPVSTCLDFYPNSQFTYIILYITQSGPLNLLIQGNVSSGFLDVSIFNIPTGQLPCDAILNTNNEIGCNYAAAFSGCNQFGNVFPCPSSVPSPNVLAGQVLMIVVEDWTDPITGVNGPSTSFTLQLGPPPGAQTGPPNTTITQVGPFCEDDNPVQLQSVNTGGLWSGNGVSPTGLFDPNLALIGNNIITYSLGQNPCNSTSTTTIVVTPNPIIGPISHD